MPEGRDDGCSRSPPRLAVEILTNGALRKAEFRTHTHEPELAPRRQPTDCLRIDRQQGCDLRSGVMRLDHAITCSLVGSEATSRLLVRSFTCSTICPASSFGFSYSGQSSRNSFCSRYVCCSPSREGQSSEQYL
jgi:hypothetical protein